MEGDGARYEPGDTVVVRNTRENVVVWASVMRVVQDAPDLLACYLCVGTPNLVGADADGEITRDFRQVRQLVERRWVDHDFLYLVRPGTAHALGVAWRMPERRFVGYYVNLQRPMRRFSLGFDSLDHTLDVQIAPDRRRWQWKDEDELADRVTNGLWTPEESAAFYREGERVVAEATSGAGPFAEGWETWVPPPHWGVPEMPDGWDTADGTIRLGG